MKKQAKNYTSIIIIGCLTVAVIGLLIALLVQTNKNGNYEIDRRANDRIVEEEIKDDQNNAEKPNNVTIDDSTTNKGAASYISVERALEIALEDVGANEQNVRDIDVELDYKFNQNVYEVTFDYNGYEYEYYLNPTSGGIVKSFKEVDR